jgi:hypothetical protein
MVQAEVVENLVGKVPLHGVEKAVQDLPRQDPVETNPVQRVNHQAMVGEIFLPRVKISRFIWRGSFALPYRFI